jgi:hypothetical protein
MLRSKRLCYAASRKGANPCDSPSPC